MIHKLAFLLTVSAILREAPLVDDENRETAEMIMEKSKRRLKTFQETINDQSKAALDAMDQASRMYSGKELFDQTDKIFNNLIEQDSPRN